MLNRYLRKRETYICLITLILWGIISAVNSNFSLPSYFIELIAFNSVYFICALGILPLMIKGEIDLSIGGMMTTVSVILISILRIWALPIWVSLVVGAIVGIGFGMLNGYIIGKFKVPSVIVTLAMLYVHNGFSRYIYRKIGSNSLIVLNGAADELNVLGVDIELLTIIFIAVIVFYILHYHPMGRQIYAIGSNKKLAYRKGYSYFDSIIKVHGISGLGAGLAAAIHVLTFNQVGIDAYTGIEFELIIIVIIGGVSILGGYGTVFGTLIASLFVVVLKNGLVFARVPVFWHEMIIGMIIIVVVSYDMFRHRVNINRLTI